MTTILRPLSMLALLALAGCDDPYDAFTIDGGHDGADAGSDASEPTPIAAMCGVPVAPFASTTRAIAIDTGPLGASSPPLCSRPPAAHEAFLAIDATAGSVWHAHVAALDPGGEPSLALLDASCDSRVCVAESSYCDGSSDEHFTFAPDADGRYWLALSDASAAGSDYQLDVIELICGDGVEQHGEGCDDGNTTDEDGCDRRCRVELSALRAAENEPNDNRFEANALLLDDAGSISITGNLGGIGACTYPDTFAVASGGGALRVRIEPPDGSACSASTDAPLRLTVANAAGMVLSDESFDLTDCAEHDVGGLVAGEYVLALSTAARDVPLSYRLSVQQL